MQDLPVLIRLVRCFREGVMTRDRSTPLLMLVDGHSLAFRSYYAHANGRDGGLRTSTGIPTSVCFGFLKSLMETLKTQRPTHVAIAFDLSTPTFRHDADETYKAGRAETPDDFIPDIANLQAILTALNLTIVTAAGYEADDVIGTLATQGQQAGYRVKILSGDRDLFQLVTAERGAEQGVSVLYLSNAFARNAPAGGTEYGPAQVAEKLGVTPAQVVDYKALCGDSSDNIPGVRGIGAKTAVKLLEEFGSLEQVYQNLDQIKGATRKKLETGLDDARHSQFMAQIHLNVPIDHTLEDCKLTGFESDRVRPLLEKLELRHILRELSSLQPILGGIDDVAAALDDSANAEGDDTWFFSAAETQSSQQIQPVVVLPQVITTPAALKALVDHLKTCTDRDRPVAWDTETTALDPRDATLVGIGCCWGDRPSDVAYIPLGHTTGDNLDRTATLKALQPILESATYPKVLQNAKFDRLILKHQGIRLSGVVFDTMLASYVINPEHSHNLGDLTLRYLNGTAQSYTDLVPKGKTIADVDIQAVAHYCGTDVLTTFQLTPILRSLLQATPDLATLLDTVELPLEAVLAEMEDRGIRIDQDYLHRFSQQLEQDLAAIERQAYDIAGSEFNLGSPKQLSELLFETLGLSTKKSRKIKTGYSTDAATLEKLQGDHPVIDCILEHRTLSKLKSTYVDALPALVHAKTQRVHTDFNQAITATGRLSSSHPNLQNIPIRTAFSRQIRAAFVPEPGWILAAADYSQIELRILAHLSGEPVLIEAYQNRQDVHTLTAQLLLEKDTISSDERRLGKIINFGVIYGMGATRFAREAGVSRTEAKTFIDRFNERYPRVFAYLQQMQREAIALGYVKTILGRRRYFDFDNRQLKDLRGTDPDSIDLDRIKSPGMYDAQQLRAAANAPIQGSSADIIKIAMVRLHEVLPRYQTRMLLQVHDELVFEMPPDEWETVSSEIQQIMESAVSLNVPLVADIRSGQNWMEAK
jgi:DNA polymerase-1